MAVTRITDVVDPKILAQMTLEKLPNNMPLLPGVFANSEIEGFPVGTKGTLWEIPYQKPLGNLETFIAGTGFTAQKFEQSKYKMVVIRAGGAWVEDKIVQLAAAKDPADYFSTQLAEKMTEHWFDKQLIVLEGGIPSANRSDGSGAAISAAVIDTAKSKLGDRADALKYIVMHSAKFRVLNQAKEITWQPANSILPIVGAGSLYVVQSNDVSMVPTVAGMIVYQSDRGTKITATTPTYKSYLLGDGAMGKYDQQKLVIGVDKDELKQEFYLVPNFDYVMCLHGVDYTSTSYTDANLADTANSTLKWDQKLVKAVRLLTL